MTSGGQQFLHSCKEDLPDLYLWMMSERVLRRSVNAH